VKARGAGELVRGLGSWAAAAIVVGTMIGTGIFIVPGDMARSTGAAGLVMLVWIVGGTLSLFGALAAAELGAALPEAGGTYAYLSRAYGPVWGFLFGWMYSVVGAPTSIATIAAGLMRFFGFLFPVVATPFFVWHFALPFAHQPHAFTFTWAEPFAVVAIGIVTFINYLGVKLGGRIQVALTIVKIGAIIAVIAVGFFFGGRGSAADFHFSAAAGAGTAGLAGFLTAMVGALWAYDGWVNVNYVGSEVKNPERNIPLALVGGVLLVCGLYVAMSAACFYVLPFSKIVASSVVASDLVSQATGHNLASWLTIAMIVCALGTLNSSILTNARVPYAMARDGLFFRVVRGVDLRFRTPARALVFQGIFASVLALTGTFEDLFSLFIFSGWIFYALQTAAVIPLRWREPGLPRPYRTWGYPVTPVIFVIGAVALTVNLWIQRPVRSSIGLGLILFGLVFYRGWRNRAATEDSASSS
jgi:basic amino acid/polyamine antiporter, APA family